jgi:hypothetical protein
LDPPIPVHGDAPSQNLSGRRIVKNRYAIKMSPMTIPNRSVISQSLSQARAYRKQSPKKTIATTT